MRELRSSFFWCLWNASFFTEWRWTMSPITRRNECRETGMSNKATHTEFFCIDLDYVFQWYWQQCIELLSMLVRAGQWRELVTVRERRRRRRKNNIASRPYRSIIIIIVDFSIVGCSPSSAHEHSLNENHYLERRNRIDKKKTSRKKERQSNTFSICSDRQEIVLVLLFNQ